jgi:integrase
MTAAAWFTPPEDGKPKAMPEGFHPNGHHRDLAADLGIDLEEAFAVFTEHHAAKGSRFLDWNRALNTWLRREKQFSQSRSTASRRPRPNDAFMVHKTPERPSCPVGFCDGSGWYMDRATRRPMDCECRSSIKVGPVEPSSRTLPAEANSGTPSPAEVEQMARRRFQAPTPFREGHFWWLFHWQDEFADGKRIRKRKRTKLAPASMSEREVKKIAAEFLRPLNQGLVTVGSAIGFEEYVNTVYTTTVLPLMAKATQDRYRGILENYLKPTFSKASLRDLTPLTLQRYFTGLVNSNLSYESKDKIRDVLSSVLSSAKDYGLLITNPAEGIRLPRDRRGRRTKPYVDPPKFSTLLTLIAEPYSTMVYVAVFTGLRVSELIGLRWRNVGVDSITVEQRCCRGDWGAPKSQASNATIAVNREVLARIERLKTLTVEVKGGGPGNKAIRKYKIVKSCGSDDLVFQSVKDGQPMRDNNILSRHIKPAGRILGMPWLNWRCLRTSHATWLKLAGADIKDAQAQMRHSRASTTLDVYQQFVPESQRKVVDRLSQLADVPITFQ